MNETKTETRNKKHSDHIKNIIFSTVITNALNETKELAPIENAPHTLTKKIIERMSKVGLKIVMD